uniref:Uncharacterized protein n=1 Tax=Picea glauca TaxID=3330 RepID=A0A101M4K8_PICGL|nr:hypothetical protein ABT39_MTgene751 [Picea glauca]
MHVLSPSIRTRVTLLPASTERDGSLGCGSFLSTGATFAPVISVQDPGSYACSAPTYND